MSTQAATETPQPLSIQPTISRNVRVLLVAAGWDQGDLAQAVGLSEPQVSRKMKNKGSSWTPDDLSAMADAFSHALGLPVDVGTFFRDVDRMFDYGSFSSVLRGLDILTGQGSLLDDDLEPLDHFGRAELAAV